MPLLHYQPADGLVVGIIPFFWQGEYHLFYLKQGQPDGLRWEHIASRVLTDWRRVPMEFPAVGEGAPDASGCWSGSIIRRAELFHMFYTARAPNGAGQAVRHAASVDLANWQSDPGDPIVVRDARWYERSDWRDPFVFWNDEESCYWMLVTARAKDALMPRSGCIALAKSADLERWEVQPPLWTPYLAQAPECPEMFPFGERWYMLFSAGRPRYRVARSPGGPWGAPAVESLDGPWLYAARSLGDGQRRLLFGWVPTRVGETDSGAWQWGGHLALPRQLEPSEDGGLSVHCPDEIPDKFGPVVLGPDEISAFDARLGRWIAGDDRLAGQSRDGFAYALWREAPDDLALRVEITMDAAPTRAGLLLRAADDLERAYAVTLEPLFQRMTVRPWRSSGEAEPFTECPLRIVRGEPISLQMALEGSILEVLANHRTCMTSRVYDLRQGRVGLFVENGVAEFAALTAWSLAAE